MKASLVLFILFPFFTFSQVQVGSEINGIIQYTNLGDSVSASADGSIIAIGAPGNADGTGGSVRVYANQSDSWNQIGNDIKGEAMSDYFAQSVSLSNNGNIVAIGATQSDINGGNSGPGYVRFFENQSGNWVQIGNTIYGRADGDAFGYSVSLSGDGSVVAIGAPTNDENELSSGKVRIFENQSDIWTQIGDDLNGAIEENNYFGVSVSLSDDGSVVAIGAPSYRYGYGSVSIYKNQSGVWTNIGYIEDEVSGDFSGRPVSLSGDGNTIAIGALGNDDFIDESGQVRVYENITGTWTQIGEDMNGLSVQERFGWALSLSFDGSILAIGITFKDDNGPNSGQVRVYKNLSGNWIQSEIDINGDIEFNQFGHSVSLSDDGNYLAIGTPYHGATYSEGQVKVYDLSSAIFSVDERTLLNFNLSPNPTQDVLNIKSNLPIDNVKMYSTQGVLIGEYFSNEIDVSQLSVGLYFIKIFSDGITVSKKFIKK